MNKPLLSLIIFSFSSIVLSEGQIRVEKSYQSIPSGDCYDSLINGKVLIKNSLFQINFHENKSYMFELITSKDQYSYNDEINHKILCSLVNIKN